MRSSLLPVELVKNLLAGLIATVLWIHTVPAARAQNVAGYDPSIRTVQGVIPYIYAYSLKINFSQ